MLFLLTLFGCPQPKPTYSCKADENWILNPQQPSDVAPSESFCDFYQFGWEWFLSQTSPSTTSPNQRVFETHRVYHPNVENQCSLQLQKGRKHQISLMMPRIGKTDFEDKQADQHVLYDQNGNILYYNIWYTEEMCKATDKFIAGTMEIKGSWKIINEKELKDYFHIQTSEHEYMGLVGFHMAIWTPKHNEMLWYTWEHSLNAPLCNGTSDIEQYNFTSKKASKCLSDKKDCSEFNFNVATKIDGATPPIISKPNEICREFNNGNQKEKSINGNDNELNSQVIDELNTQINEMLEKLPKDHDMKVWKNYQMIGGIWTKDGNNSGNSPVPTKTSKGDPSSMQRGSLELTNMSMETFEQGDTSYVPNCFGCHNFDDKKPLQVSHIYKHLK
jgi:hypothetical protein